MSERGEGITELKNQGVTVPRKQFRSTSHIPPDSCRTLPSQPLQGSLSRGDPKLTTLRAFGKGHSPLCGATLEGAQSAEFL